jgi:hypothetical protein
VLSIPARAATLHDPPHAKGPLDIEWLVADKHDANAPLHLKIVTYGRWKSRLLEVDGPNRLFVLFNPDRADREQFVGEIFFRDGDLRMRVERTNGDFVRSLQVFHPRADTVTMVIPRGLPNPDGQTWLAAEMKYRSDMGPCSTRTCHDRAPDTGWLKLTPGL